MGNTSSSSALQSCLKNVCAGQQNCVAFPTNPVLTYHLEWMKPYNLNKIPTPVAVTRPMTAEQIAGVVKCAVASKVKVQPRSGGHSYGNYGLGGDDGAVVVDLVNFQQFSMDEKYQATIGAGTLLGDVTKKLHENGGRAMAHGTCPQVGIGGHATIGGLGPPSRMWGTSLDHVVDVTVVTAKGDIVKASESENSDLFFALKGAGASFGIITEFRVRTHPEPRNVVEYTYDFTFGKHEDMASTFEVWQTLISDPNLDRRFASQFILHELGAVVLTVFYGTEGEYEATGIPARLPKGGKLAFAMEDWLGSVGHAAEVVGLQAVGGVPIPFYTKTLAFRKEDLIPRSGITELFKHFGKDKGTIIWFTIFDLAGGAVSDVPQDKTAYAHRDKLFFVQSYGVGIPTVSQKTKDWLNGVNTIIRDALPNAPFGAYPGYVEPDLADGQEQYWGANLPRLKDIKKMWDPKDVFHNPQSVPPAK
ncbi:FAD-binding domain-containing protein [Eremomyces bilateralis CBS 781.70]|uniref:FAD-binding domain-containing protein n=1 Tax=Eremomyces bilateralis CBS 781.70 TaxID=1392243 RepID=A0A6G1G9F9_9PEZI|nr:FAD-binding domain-containing protein [Eremomyces bilateralis CBS 781.70]KAF1814622.1 FAD-binding domain-containing protein [Eremomyces bilateralis CBS 781.70]